MSESRLHKSYLNARVNVFFYLVTLFIRGEKRCVSKFGRSENI